MKAHAIQKRDWDEKIEIINPDIVMCGGTFSIIQEIVKMNITKCESGAVIGKALNTIFCRLLPPNVSNKSPGIVRLF